ncbi:hypothetical protein ONO23_02784 [Micromonospora noduli]|nr:hypothetical protein ONO23_02784 [Micromonospora noduli]
MPALKLTVPSLLRTIVNRSQVLTAGPLAISGLVPAPSADTKRLLARAKTAI